MDAQRFDRLTRALSEVGTRRGLFRLLGTLPVFGGLFALLDLDEVDAKGRRKRRKKRHKHGKGRRRKHHKKCKPKSLAKTCAGKCGLVKNHCKKTVECGSCACSADNPCPSGQCCGADGSCDACLVFVTSNGFTGDLGGLNGADDRCQADAAAAGQPGTYRAWLADETGSPATRFVRATVPYVLQDGTVVANDWDDLTTAKPGGEYLAAPIAQTASGDPVLAGIWTHVRPDGTARGMGGLNCLNWESNSEFEVGDLGDNTATTAAWTETVVTSSCSNPAIHLACFQQG